MRKLKILISLFVITMMCVLECILLFPAYTLAQTKRNAPKPKKIHWYMDYTVTVKGSGRKEGDAGGGPTIVWNIDRTYSGVAVLDERHVNLTTEEAKDWKIQAEAFKTERKIRFTQKDIKNSLIRVQINDKLELITDEECSDNSDETTTDIKIWKTDRAVRSIFPINLDTDNTLSIYNVSIPIYLVGEDGGWANIPMSSQMKYSRTFNVKPTKNSTAVVETEARIPALPNVQGLIGAKLFIIHEPDKPFPSNFSTAWEYDSGNLQPDEPLIQDVPESKTNAKVRIIYRFSKTPIY